MKERSKRSPIWKVDISELEKIIAESISKSEILRKFGLSNKGSNAKTLRARCLKEAISLEHLLGRASNKGKKFPLAKKIDLSDILKENSTYNRTHLKARLLKEGIVKNVCSECGLTPFWNGKELKLQLDHKNGIHDDNRLENLRMICPNCHSQTESYSGKNKKKI